MAVDRLEIARQRRLASQAGARTARPCSAPSRSWPMNETDPALALGSGHRLADVVEQGAEAKPGAPRQLVGERLAEQRADLVGAVAGEALEVALDLEQFVEHLDRVVVDVEVVVGVLVDAAEVARARAGPPRSPRAGRAVAGRAAGRAARRAGAARRTGARRRARRRAAALGASERVRLGARARSRARRRAGRRAASAAGRRSKLRSETARSSRASRSARPPVGSSGSPPPRAAPRSR